MWGYANYYPSFFFIGDLNSQDFGVYEDSWGWQSTRKVKSKKKKNQKTQDTGYWEWCGYPGNAWCAVFFTSVIVLMSCFTMVSRQTEWVCPLTAELRKGRGLSQGCRAPEDRSRLLLACFAVAGSQDTDFLEGAIPSLLLLRQLEAPSSATHCCYRVLMSSQVPQHFLVWEGPLLLLFQKIKDYFPSKTHFPL